MKKHLDRIVLLFGVVALVLMVIWLTKSCNHKTVEKKSWVVDSLTYYRNRAKAYSDSVSVADQNYEASYSDYTNNDSSGREQLRARIKQNVSDSLRKRTP